MRVCQRTVFPRYCYTTIPPYSIPPADTSVLDHVNLEDIYKNPAGEVFGFQALSQYANKPWELRDAFREKCIFLNSMFEMPQKNGEGWRSEWCEKYGVM